LGNSLRLKQKSQGRKKREKEKQKGMTARAIPQCTLRPKGPPGSRRKDNREKNFVKGPGRKQGMIKGEYPANLASIPPKSIKEKKVQKKQEKAKTRNLN